MRIIEIIESKQESYRSLDIVLTKIRVLSDLILEDIQMIQDNPEMALDPEFNEILSEIDSDIEKLRYGIYLVNVGLGNDDTANKNKQFMMNKFNSVVSKRKLIKANVSEADQPPQGSLYSPLSAATRDKPQPDPKAAMRQRREAERMRRFMGHRDWWVYPKPIDISTTINYNRTMSGAKVY